MGVGVSVACVTCKKDYYCGYGSYGSAETRKLRFPSSEHVHHQLVWYNEDYTSTKNGDLVSSYPPDWIDEVEIKDFSQFEFIDLTKEEPATT